VTDLRSRRPAIAIAAGTAVLLLLAVGLRGCGGVELSAIPDVPSTQATEAPVTSVVNYAAISLPPVDGSTTTIIEPVGGSAHLAGTVAGPSGLVPGATVRVERLVLDQALRTDVTTGPDGHWDLPGIAGGRYRVRAFLPPTMAQTDPEVFFLRGDEERALDLTMRTFDGLGIEAAVAPDPPLVDEPVNVVVQLANRTVDSDGVARAEPLPGIYLAVVDTGAWELQSQSPAFTDADGRAVFAFVCRQAGPNQLQVRILSTNQVVPVELPDCVQADEPATTTTTDGSSTTTTKPGRTTTTTTG
jgi:hypothetical protein